MQTFAIAILVHKILFSSHKLTNHLLSGSLQEFMQTMLKSSHQNKAVVSSLATKQSRKCNAGRCCNFHLNIGIYLTDRPNVT